MTPQSTTAWTDDESDATDPDAAQERRDVFMSGIDDHSDDGWRQKDGRGQPVIVAPRAVLGRVARAEMACLKCGDGLVTASERLAGYCAVCAANKVAARAIEDYLDARDSGEAV